MKNKNMQRYIAGCCFIVPLVVSVIENCYFGNYYIGAILSILVEGSFYLLIAAGLLLQNKWVSITGCVIAVLFIFPEVINYFLSLTVDEMGNFTYWLWISPRILGLVYWTLLLAAFLDRQRRKVLCVAAEAVVLLELLIRIIRQFEYGRYYGVASSLFMIGYLVPLGIGAYLISNSVDLEKEPVAKAASGIKTSTESTISRLDKLADLLDKGIITQQEFDEKKKQIL